MANIADSYDVNAEPQAPMDVIPAGDYQAQIVESEIADISRNDNKGRCMVLVWKIEGGDFDGRQIWQRLNIWPENMNNQDKVVQIANSQFASIREATGVAAPMETEELHFRPCMIKVGIRRDKNGQYPDQNEVKGVYAVQQAAPPQRQAPAPQQQRALAPANNSGGQSAPWRKTG